MKLKYIDALRGIAILLVIIVHTSQHGYKNYNSAINLFFNFAAKGVQLFFLASAFTLFLSYNYRIKSENNVNRNFYIRRFFRIAPMYYIGIAYFIYQSNLTTHFGGFNILANFLFIHGISPYWINNVVPGGWSITVEMTFYLILPLLATRIKNLNQSVSFLIISFFISNIFRLFLQKNALINDELLWGEFTYYNFITQLPAFGLGIIAYFLIIKKDYKITSLNLLLIFLILSAHFIWKIIIPNFILIGISFLILIYALSIKEYKLFVNRFTLYLGKISYSLYLVHFAVLFWLNRFNFVDFFNIDNYYLGILNYLIRLFLVIIISATISSLLYQFIEKPFQKIGKHLIKILRNRHELRLSKVENKQ